MHLLDNTTTQPSKFGTENWDEINDEIRGRQTVKLNSKQKCLCQVYMIIVTQMYLLTEV